MFLSVSFHRNVSDPWSQGLRRRPRRRHGHYQRRGRPLWSRGQERVLHLDGGWSGGGKEWEENGEENKMEDEEKRGGEERRGKKPPFVFTTLQFFTRLEGWWEGKGGNELWAWSTGTTLFTLIQGREILHWQMDELKSHTHTHTNTHTNIYTQVSFGKNSSHADLNARRCLD